VFQPEDDRFVFFVVEFTDIGLSSLFGGDAGAFVDRSTDVMELVPADRRGMIIDALYEVDDVEQKVALVEQFLKEMLPSDDTLARVQLVRDAVTTIREASGWVSVQEVSDGLDVSERHLRRQFAETTGLSPKVFARILRFRGAIATLLESRDSTELFSRASRAMPADYTDQAHFNHEFKQFTGYAPTALPFDRFETYREYDRADELAARAE
jgi:AraC-like DNA-binding protein